MLKEQSAKIFKNGGTPSPAAPRDTSQFWSCLLAWEVSRLEDSKSHIPSDNFPTVRSELSKDTHQTCPNKGLKASDGCQWRCDEC